MFTVSSWYIMMEEMTECLWCRLSWAVSFTDLRKGFIARKYALGILPVSDFAPGQICRTEADRTAWVTPVLTFVEIPVLLRICVNGGSDKSWLLWTLSFVTGGWDYKADEASACCQCGKEAPGIQSMARIGSAVQNYSQDASSSWNRSHANPVNQLDKRPAVILNYSPATKLHPMVAWTGVFGTMMLELWTIQMMLLMPAKMEEIKAVPITIWTISCKSEEDKKVMHVMSNLW